MHARFNKFIQRSGEHGLVIYFDQIARHIIRLNKMSRSEASCESSNLIKFSDLKFIFIIYVVGAFVAIGVFLFELLSFVHFIEFFGV